MFDPKQIRHYTELITNELDDLENALDDDCPDIQSDIEALIDEFSSYSIGDGIYFKNSIIPKTKDE